MDELGLLDSLAKCVRPSAAAVSVAAAGGKPTLKLGVKVLPIEKFDRRYLGYGLS